MKKFLIQTLLFALLCSIILLIVLTIGSFNVSKRTFNNYETESNTLLFKENKHYDIMFTGISHARNLSRHKNHLRVESILNQSIINIAQGAGTCGVNEQFFYLKYFYKLNNSIDKLVFILSPPMMYSEKLPVASNTFKYEVFSFNFLTQYILFDSYNKSQRIIHYLQSKLKPQWIFHRPNSRDEMQDSLLKIDSNVIKNGLFLAYGDSLNHGQFNKSCQIIKQEIEFAEKNGIQIIMIIPPALFGQWPGHDNVHSFAKNMQKKYNITYYDFSDTVLEPKYYYDHHHLNTNGVVYFTQNYLKKVL